MKKKLKFNCFLWISVLAISIFLYANITQVEPSKAQNLSIMDDIEKEGNPKMEFVLYKLMKTYFEQGIEKAKEFAHQRGIDMKGDYVRVVLEAKTSRRSEEINKNVYLVSNKIKSLGGEIETTYNNLIQSLIPISVFQELSSLSSIKYLRLPRKPVPCVVSEGVEKTSADLWQNLDAYRSTEKVKVCILDVGFKGYRKLLGSELPESVKTKSFTPDGKVTTSNYGNPVHGTACAEIIHDMAPNAGLYLVNFYTDVEHHNAVDWIISQGIDIISYSCGWINWGAGDGTGWICEDVEKARSQGIVWVSAAGNEAQSHWEGKFNDPDNDGWHNFYGIDETLDFYVPANTKVGSYLNWNDWGNWDGISYDGSNQDYDLYLFCLQGNRYIYVDRSINYQTGTQLPIENIYGYQFSKPTYWGIAIRKYSANKNVKLEIFIEGNSEPIYYNHPYGSIIIPADSNEAVTVGATDCYDDSYHSYSSRGPTSDKRIKPDFTAPSGVSSFTYGDYSFYGTSAATPHMAGAFALLKGKTPYSLEQIKTILDSRAKDLGPDGKDNKFGIGRLKLSK